MQALRIGAVALTLGLGCVGVHGQSPVGLVGVWRVTEIVSPKGEPNANPQPTVYIFTARHYSHVSVTSVKPRPNHAGPDVTDSQKLEMWEPFTATAGTYELKGNEFTIRPMVAKNPGFMTPGNSTTFELTADGPDIWIRATRTPAGSIPAAVSNRVRLVRLE
jgi:hypothetical protein